MIIRLIGYGAGKASLENKAPYDIRLKTRARRELMKRRTMHFAGMIFILQIFFFPYAVFPDPLLRGNWISQETQRARGFFHSIGSILERSESRVEVKDSAGRRFELDRHGDIHFNPLEGNWRPVVPSLADAALHLAEAKSLEERGGSSEALGLYFSIVAMARYGMNPPAFLKSAAAEAAVRINRMKNRVRGFDSLETENDPVIFFDSNAGETLLTSDRFGWRFSFPGEFRFMRSRAMDENTETRSVVHLGRQGITLTVASDLFHPSWKIPGLEELRVVWDERRSLSVQRKQFLGFEREELSFSRRFCRSSREGDLTYCSASSYRIEKPVVYTGLEFFALREFHSFYMDVRHPPDQRTEAEAILIRALEKMHFSSSGRL